MQLRSPVLGSAPGRRRHPSCGARARHGRRHDEGRSRKGVGRRAHVELRPADRPPSGFAGAPPRLVGRRPLARRGPGLEQRHVRRRPPHREHRRRARDGAQARRPRERSVASPRARGIRGSRRAGSHPDGYANGCPSGRRTLATVCCKVRRGGRRDRAQLLERDRPRRPARLAPSRRASSPRRRPRANSSTSEASTGRS